MIIIFDIDNTYKFDDVLKISILSLKKYLNQRNFIY